MTFEEHYLTVLQSYGLTIFRSYNLPVFRSSLNYKGTFFPGKIKKVNLFTCMLFYFTFATNYH
jgi:hypothetical protein